MSQANGLSPQPTSSTRESSHCSAINSKPPAPTVRKPLSVTNDVGGRGNASAVDGRCRRSCLPRKERKGFDVAEMEKLLISFSCKNQIGLYEPKRNMISIFVDNLKYKFG